MLLKISVEDLQVETGGKYRETHFPHKSTNPSKASNILDVYVRNIYPSGHGYPCPNPMGPPIRIGDIGILTSIGFVALTNLYDCQSTSLQAPLSSLPSLSKEWQDPMYFSEGESITGGVSDCVTMPPEGP
jgi:hypothetical protein